MKGRVLTYLAIVETGSYAQPMGQPMMGGQPMGQPMMGGQPMGQPMMAGQPGQAPQPQWMTKPEAIPGCPPGLEYLTQIDQLLVHQQVELFEGQTHVFSFIIQVQHYLCLNIIIPYYFTSECTLIKCCPPSFQCI